MTSVCVSPCNGHIICLCCERLISNLMTQSFNWVCTGLRFFGIGWPCKLCYFYWLFALFFQNNGNGQTIWSCFKVFYPFHIKGLVTPVCPITLILRYLLWGPNICSYYTVIELGCTDLNFIGIAGIFHFWMALFVKIMEMGNILMVHLPFSFLCLFPFHVSQEAWWLQSGCPLVVITFDCVVLVLHSYYPVISLGCMGL